MLKTKEREKCFDNFSETAKGKLQKALSMPADILLVSHKNPDGDAIGSALGLAHVLEKIGHNTRVFFPDEAPDFLKWMPGYDKAGIYERSPKSFPGFDNDPDIIFFLDFNSLERIGKIEEALAKLDSLSILLDHHPGIGEFADYAIVDTARGSTSEMVFLFLEQIGLLTKLDENSATCLYTGLITDTLGLQVSSSYKEIYTVTGELVAAGARIGDVYNNVYHQFSHDRMKLLGYCLAEKMVVMPDIGVAYIWLTKEEMARFNHIKGDTEGFVNYPLSIKGVVFTVLFTEIEGEIKLSLRSKGDIPVNSFAQMYFSGGGHMNASGGRSSMDMNETISFFEEKVKLYMKEIRG